MALTLKESSRDVLLAELKQQNRRLEKALQQIETLEGLLPICSNCKKIRDKSGGWQIFEAYIQEHSKAIFSHGLESS